MPTARFYGALKKKTRERRLFFAFRKDKKIAEEVSLVSLSKTLKKLGVDPRDVVIDSSPRESAIRKLGSRITSTSYVMRENLRVEHRFVFEQVGFFRNFVFSHSLRNSSSLMESIFL